MQWVYGRVAVFRSYVNDTLLVTQHHRIRFWMRWAWVMAFFWLTFISKLWWMTSIFLLRTVPGVSCHVTVRFWHSRCTLRSKVSYAVLTNDSQETYHNLVKKNLPLDSMTSKLTKAGFMTASGWQNKPSWTCRCCHEGLL